MFRSTILALALLSANASAAMILGFGVEADYLAPAATGSFDYKGGTTDFNGDRESGLQLGAYIEHPIPIVPNLRVDYTSEVTFSGGGNEVAISQTDITPYYEILDNIVDLDIGITAKMLNGTSTIAGSDESFSAVIPMGYIGAAVSVPGLPISFAGSVKYISMSGDSFTDARIKAVWDIAAGLAAQVGYRHESLKLDDLSDITTDATFKGPFVGVGFTF